MPSRLEFTAQFNRAGKGPAPRRRAGAPMRLLLLGDFSGQAAADRPALAARPTRPVNVDNLDEVMARLAPRLALPSGEVQFRELEDFHPDALFQRLDLFEALRQARARPPAAGGGDLLGALLGKPAGPAAGGLAPSAAPAQGIDALIRSIVAPHIVPDTSGTVKPYLAAVDAAIAEQMRQLLHHPAFQALESAWRGVQWLIQSLELDESLELHLFDVTRDELQADLVAAQGRVDQTGLYAALVDRWRNQPGAEGWSLLGGLYSFGPSDADIAVLAALGITAQQAGGPFIGSALPEMVGAGSFASPVPPREWVAPAGWQALRGSEVAPCIGLTAPRVLLRLPYGKRHDPVTQFSFEEFVGAHDHESLLWGHGALAVSLLIGRSFMARGWEMEPGDEREVGDLPAYTYEHDGERELQACAEGYLGDGIGQALLAAGLIPLLSHRHANAVSVMRFQTIAEPASALTMGTERSGT